MHNDYNYITNIIENLSFIKFIIKWIRRTAQLAPSAYLASTAASVQLISAILPARLGCAPDPDEDHALSVWTSLGWVTRPSGLAAASQKAWDGQIVQHISDNLLSSALDDYTKARLMAVSAPTPVIG